MSNTDDLYGKDHVPDPVTEVAVATAMAATDRGHAPSRWEKFVWVVSVALFVVASFASVVGLINNVQISHQNDKLAKQAGILSSQSECLISVVVQLQADQSNRLIIAADDRDAVRELVKKVFTTRTAQEKIQAYNDFVASSNSNDERRALIAQTLKPSCTLPPGLKYPSLPRILPSPKKAEPLPSLTSIPSATK